MVKERCCVQGDFRAGAVPYDEERLRGESFKPDKGS
jgi:hypothetical protein